MTFLSSLLIGFFILAATVWVLKALHVGQNIRQEGPKTHFKKAGTPTMGGIGIFITIIIFTLVLINVDMNLKLLGLIVLFTLLTILGFMDDFIKTTRRENQGLRGWQKILGQSLSAIVFLVFLFISGHHHEAWGIFSNPYIYYPFLLLVILATTNAVNLTDGLDGLASSTLTVAYMAFAILAFKLDQMDIAIISIVAAGTTLAFLKFNFHPAEIFMGDVGSVGLGGLLAGIAILLHKEFILIIIGGVFVVEALSVILQVVSYKTFGVRMFRMSPLHHHFELLGFSEVPILLGFLIISILFAIFGIWLGAS